MEDFFGPGVAVSPLPRRHAHSERDPALDLRHHPLDPAGSGEIADRQRGPHGLVAAADVVANTGRGDVPLVRDATADRLRIAGVVVGAEDAVFCISYLHAPL